MASDELLSSPYFSESHRASTAIRTGRGLAAMFSVCVALAGCSLIGTPGTRSRRRRPSSWSRRAPPLPEPVATHRFELATPDHDVVGVVQITTRRRRHAAGHRAALQRRR
jgi:hypothetical protein